MNQHAGGTPGVCGELVGGYQGARGFEWSAARDLRAGVGIDDGGGFLLRGVHSSHMKAVPRDRVAAANLPRSGKTAVQPLTPEERDGLVGWA